LELANRRKKTKEGHFWVKESTNCNILFCEGSVGLVDHSGVFKGLSLHYNAKFRTLTTM